MNNLDLIEIYLTILPSADIESLDKINKQWTDWIKDYYHPMSLPTNKVEDVPFYDMIVYDKYKELYDKVLSKKIPFDFDFVSYEKQFQFHRRGKKAGEGIFYPISCDNFKQVVVRMQGQYDIISNTVLPKLDKNILEKRLPLYTYLIGLQCDKIYWYQYLSDKEVKEKKCAESFPERVVKTRNLLKNYDKRLMCLEGNYHKIPPKGLSLYSKGDFFETIIYEGN